jgi:hypothetical protein
MKLIFKTVVLVFTCSIALLVIALSVDQEVTLESRESKTSDGGPVFNKIKWFQFRDKDVWMMNQSHHGSADGSNAWDRLAIVVDKTKNPKTARFYQFEPGVLQWSENLKERSFSVSCFMCHNNGPRSIRPNYESSFAPMSTQDRLRISYWNLRIKSYGRVIANSVHDDRDKTLLPPFRYRSTYENEPLKVATCINCHKEEGFLARGILRRQQMPTIKFMVESGQMPPFGFWLSNSERREIELFFKGF